MGVTADAGQLFSEAPLEHPYGFGVTLPIVRHLIVSNRNYF